PPGYNPRPAGQVRRGRGPELSGRRSGRCRTGDADGGAAAAALTSRDNQRGRGTHTYIPRKHRSFDLRPRRLCRAQVSGGNSTDEREWPALSHIHHRYSGRRPAPREPATVLRVGVHHETLGCLPRHAAHTVGAGHQRIDEAPLGSVPRWNTVSASNAMTTVAE